MFLHTIASRLSKVCYEKYGVYTPELNAAPILWRATYFMGGSREYIIEPEFGTERQS